MPTLRAVFKLFDGYSSTIDKVSRKTDEATNKILSASGATDNFNNKLKSTGAVAETASRGIGKLIGTFVSLAAAKKGMEISDEFVNTSARLNLINDGLQTQEELQNKIFAAANRSRGAYSDMAGAISKMGLLAGEQFKSNDELVAFTELLQKSFKISGASQTEQSSALLQLSQAMASGRLQGDELVSIMENAPMVYDAIAKYTGLTKGELKKVASEGAITADIIKNAMFAAGDDINAKFKEMPMTFSDVWNKIKNGALQAFEPIIQAVNNFINSAAFNDIANGILVGINIISAAIGGLISFVSDNWSIIQAILLATGIYLAAVGVIGLCAGLKTAAGWIVANLPMLAIIATIAAVIYMLNLMGVTAGDIFGFIGGVIGTFVTFFYNAFVVMWNAVANFVNFFGNVFNHPVASIKILFYDMVSDIIGYITTMAQAIEDVINKIPGVEVNITSGLEGFKGKLESASTKVKNETGWVEYVKTKEFMDYSDGYTKGSNMGKNIQSNLSGNIDKLTNSLTGAGDKGFDMSKFGTAGKPNKLGTPGNPASVKGIGKNDAVKVNMSDEDLKYLRDVAERDYINKFTTATLAPNVQFTFGDIHEEADAYKVVGRIKKILREEIATASEGVY